MERKCKYCHKTIPMDSIICPYCAKKYSNEEIEEEKKTIELRRQQIEKINFKNKRKIVIIAIIVIVSINCFFAVINLAPWEEENASQPDIIRVDISCWYDYYSSGDIKVDGVYYCGAVAANGYRLFTYEIDKSELSVQKDTYRITLTLEGGGVTASKTAYDVSSYVKFQVSDSLFDESLFITVEETK